MPPSKQVNGVGHSFTTVCEFAALNAALHNVEKKKKKKNMPHCLGLTAVAEWRGDVTPLMHAVAAWSRVRSEPV